MSLTSIMKGGLSKFVVAKIPIPSGVFNASEDCVACPKTNHYFLVGTAFDYLLRSEIKRLNPKAKESKLIGMSSVALVRDLLDKGIPIHTRNGLILGEEELRAMLRVSAKFEKERKDFMKNGVLTDSFIETTIKFARLDSLIRALVYQDVEEAVDPLDIEDMRALYNLIPSDLKSPINPTLLDPTFGEASILVGGADVDLIIGNTMIDIKTTKKMKLDQYLWSQIVGYLVLADEAIDRGENLPYIENLGLYFSRYGYLWKIKADYVRKNTHYGEVRKKLLESGSSSS